MIPKNKLPSGVFASKMIIGTAPFSKIKLPLLEGARILQHGYELGVNFWDTAELYKTHSYIGEALKHVSRSQVVILSKTFAKTKKDAQKYLNKTLKELGTDYIDIVLLHSVESVDDYKSRVMALWYFTQEIEKGKIRMIGVMSDDLKVINEAVEDEKVDIIFMPFNLENQTDEKLKLFQDAKKYGKITVATKILAEGKLSDRVKESLVFLFGQKDIDYVCLGVKTIFELETDVNIISNIFNNKAIHV